MAVKRGRRFRRLKVLGLDDEERCAGVVIEGLSATGNYKNVKVEFHIG
jgi:hypothetical protein